MDGFPLCSIDDVIESKRRSNRAKDRESLPRLEDFARYLKREQPPEIEPLPPRHRGSFGPRCWPRADAPHRAAGRAAASDRHGLSAVVEHVSELHELEPPGWSQEPERFVDIPDFFMLGWRRHLETAVYAPAPFIPHGALANARDLDARGRERHVWIRGSRPDPRAFR